MTAGSPSHLDDQGLSDLVDGIAAPSDAAHVESCEACAARVEVWRTVMAKVGSAPPAGDVDAAVDAAMAGAPVRSLGLARRAVASRPAALAAAVVAVVGLAAGLTELARGPSHHTSSTAQGAAVTTLPSRTGAAGEATNGLSSGSGSSASAAGTFSSVKALGNLGSYSSLGALVPALRDRLVPEQAPVASTGSLAPALSCIAKASAAAGKASLLLEADLTFGSQPAEVFVFAGKGSRVVFVERVAGCAQMARGTF